MYTHKYKRIHINSYMHTQHDTYCVRRDSLSLSAPRPSLFFFFAATHCNNISLPSFPSIEVAPLIYIYMYICASSLSVAAELKIYIYIASPNKKNGKSLCNLISHYSHNIVELTACLSETIRNDIFYLFWIRGDSC